MEFYPYFEEEIPKESPPVDSDHAHDLVKRRSITGILVMLNKTSIRCLYKRQKTVVTSTNGSELVALRIAMELILEFRYMLRSLGVLLDGSALMLGDNISVVLNTTGPSSVLKEKHNKMLYHRVRVLEIYPARLDYFTYYFKVIQQGYQLEIQ
jgi:hypothetical protein